MFIITSSVQVSDLCESFREEYAAFSVCFARQFHELFAMKQTD